MKTYVISYNPFLIVPNEIMNYLDTKQEILNWYLPFPGSIFIVSNYNTTALANMLASRYPLSQFLITEANRFNTDGRLANIAWDFIGNPKSSGRWDNNLGTALAPSLLGGQMPLSVPTVKK